MNLDSFRSVYRLVAAHTTSNFAIKTWNAFFIGTFTILGSFSGTGVASAAAGIFAGNYLMNQKLADKIFLLDAFGGLVGLIFGLVISLVVVRGDAKIKYGSSEKFIGGGQRWMIFSGAVWPLLAALFCLFEPLGHVFGDSVGSYVALGIMMAIFVAAMVLFDRLPNRLIILIGVVGWIMTFILAIGLVLWVYSGIFRMLKV